MTHWTVVQGWRRGGVRGSRATQRGRHCGWSFIELMIALAVMLIAVSIALPSFDRMLADTRLAAATNRLLAALVSARLTAISSNQPVTFCAGNATDGCHGRWDRQEWIVFIDQNRDGLIGDGDSVRMTDRLESQPDIRLSANGPFRKAVVFRSSGSAETLSGAFAAGRVRVCAAKPIQQNANDLVLIGSGRAVREVHDFSGNCPNAGR